MHGTNYTVSTQTINNLQMFYMLTKVNHNMLILNSAKHGRLFYNQLFAQMYIYTEPKWLDVFILLQFSNA